MIVHPLHRPPEGDLPALRRRDDAAPTRRALAGSSSTDAPSRRARLGAAPISTIDVGQPRVRRAALDDAAAEAAAEIELEVAATARVALFERQPQSSA